MRVAQATGWQHEPPLGDSGAGLGASFVQDPPCGLREPKRLPFLKGFTSPGMTGAPKDTAWLLGQVQPVDRV